MRATALADTLGAGRETGRWRGWCRSCTENCRATLPGQVAGEGCGERGEPAGPWGQRIRPDVMADTVRRASYWAGQLETRRVGHGADCESCRPMATGFWRWRRSCGLSEAAQEGWDAMARCSRPSDGWAS